MACEIGQIPKFTDILQVSHAFDGPNGNKYAACRAFTRSRHLEMLLSPDIPLVDSDLFAVTLDQLKAYPYARNAKRKRLFFKKL